ncbi:MAG TPA: hypothetical protein VMX55_09960 [candidate division Zixibacteria bacterium]|nr:hypothetical protein [candidate division Zixibacteria bacterium]
MIIMNDFYPQNWVNDFLKFILSRGNKLKYIEYDVENELSSILDMAQNYFLDFLDCNPPEAHIIFRDIREAIRKHKEEKKEIIYPDDYYEVDVHFDDIIFNLLSNKLERITNEEFEILKKDKNLQLEQIQEVLFIYMNDGKMPYLDFDIDLGYIELSFNLEKHMSLSIEQSNEYEMALKGFLGDFDSILKPGKEFATFKKMVILEDYY